jgi:glycosyltransferase involved in cell wall biosynthesis
VKVLLYEQWYGGHYANYMDCLVPAIAPLCDELVIAVSRNMRESTDAVHKWARIPNVVFAEVLSDVAPGLGIRDRYAATRNLLRCLEEVRPDRTLIPSADAQSTWIALLNALGYNVVKRFGPIEGTIHYGYGYAAKTLRNRFKELVYSQTYKHLPFDAVNFVNFNYHDFAVAKGLIEPKRMRLVGDPVPQPAKIGRAAARTLLGLKPDGRYLGLLGSLDNRKAVPQILAAFRQARLRPDDRLLLAGRLDPQYAALIDAQYKDLISAGRLVVMDRFLSPGELEHGYEALDLATIAYSKSPVLASLALKAISAGTPIIADDFGWLGRAIKLFDLGTVTDAFDVDAFADAMQISLARPHKTGQPEAVRRLLAFHTPQNFVAQMTKTLRGNGSEAGQPMREWSWVLDALLPRPSSNERGSLL